MIILASCAWGRQTSPRIFKMSLKLFDIEFEWLRVRGWKSSLFLSLKNLRRIFFGGPRCVFRWAVRFRKNSISRKFAPRIISEGKSQQPCKVRNLKYRLLKIFIKYFKFFLVRRILIKIWKIFIIYFWTFIFTFDFEPGTISRKTQCTKAIAWLLLKF